MSFHEVRFPAPLSVGSSGGQAAAFTAALGVGVVLPTHVAVPQVVRDHL